VATVITKTNLPLLDMLGADSQRLSGKSSQASTPWDKFKYRKVVGKRCRSRAQNTKYVKWAPYGAGIDHSNAAVWDFPDHELRDVVEACSSSHPDACTGFSWKGRMDGDGAGMINHTVISPETRSRNYSSVERETSWLGGSTGWRTTTGGGKGE
jgi:hypothetical protein